MDKKITRAAIFHRSHTNMSYAYSSNQLHMRLRTAKGEVTEVFLRAGDPFDWASQGGGGNLNNEGASGWLGGRNYPMKKECETELHDYWLCEFTPEFYRSRYAFIVKNNTEILLIGEKRIVPLSNLSDDPALDQLVNFYCFPYLNAIDVFTPPEWVKNTVWYQIFPERFANGMPTLSPPQAQPWGSMIPANKSFFGGDLQGVIDHLDYLDALGITGIYFTPLTLAPSNHKYDAIDYFTIDPHFGDIDTLKSLCKEAHRRGIKIMLDAVFNHLGEQSPQWQDVIKNGVKSKYYNWFYIDDFPLINNDATLNKERLNYRSFSFSTGMPKLNTENPDVIEHLLEVGRYWIREFDIDAWRLDVANEVDQHFWRRFRIEMKRLKPELFILGEVWHDAHNWLTGDQFDAVMNYPMAEAILNFFAHQSIDAKTFKHLINEAFVNYPINVNEVMFSLLDSHDTPRILHLCHGDKNRVKLSFLFLLSQTGTPCIYYGSEIGMAGGSDPLNRACMEWDPAKQDRDLLQHMKKLIALRKSTPAMISHNMDWLLSDGQTLIYSKTHQHDTVFIIMNASAGQSTITLPSQLADKSVFDLYDNNIVQLSDTCTLPEYGFAIYRLNTTGDSQSPTLIKSARVIANDLTRE